MSIARATRSQLLDHLAAASAAAKHHPEYAAALHAALKDKPRSEIRAAIERVKQEAPHE